MERSVPTSAALMRPAFRLKTASQAKREAARLEVENAEDDLVQKTEVTITLMKTVLENVRLVRYLTNPNAHIHTSLSP